MWRGFTHLRGGSEERSCRISWRVSHVTRKFIEMPTCAAKKKMTELWCPNFWGQHSHQLLDLWLVWATFWQQRRAEVSIASGETWAMWGGQTCKYFHFFICHCIDLLLSCRCNFHITLSACAFQGCLQFSKWDHSHPLEEQHKETITAGAAERLPGCLVPWNALGWREGPRCCLWETCRGEYTPTSSIHAKITYSKVTMSAHLYNVFTII